MMTVPAPNRAAQAAAPAPAPSPTPSRGPASRPGPARGPRPQPGLQKPSRTHSRQAQQQAQQQQQRARGHLRVLPRPAPTRRGIGLAGMAATVLLFVTLLALAAFQAIVVQSQQQIDHLDRQIAEAQADYEQLRLQVAELESPARIVEAAVNRLGMVPPPETTYLLPDPQASAASSGADLGAAGGSALAAGPAVSAADWSEVKPYLGEGP